MITEITRSHVRLQIRDKSVTVQGEGYARGYGSPDFILYQNSIQRWDPPHESQKIDERTKDEILAQIKLEMEGRGMAIEIE